MCKFVRKYILLMKALLYIRAHIWEQPFAACWMNTDCWKLWLKKKGFSLLLLSGKLAQEPSPSAGSSAYTWLCISRPLTIILIVLMIVRVPGHLARPASPKWHWWWNWWLWGYVWDLPVWPLGGKLPDPLIDARVIPGNPVPLQQVVKPIQKNLYTHKGNTKDQYEGHKQKSWEEFAWFWGV